MAQWQTGLGGFHYSCRLRYFGIIFRLWYRVIPYPMAGKDLVKIITFIKSQPGTLILLPLKLNL